jgi:hypothetical protein
LGESLSPLGAEAPRTPRGKSQTCRNGSAETLRPGRGTRNGNAGKRSVDSRPGRRMRRGRPGRNAVERAGNCKDSYCRYALIALHFFTASHWRRRRGNGEANAVRKRRAKQVSFRLSLGVVASLRSIARAERITQTETLRRALAFYAFAKGIAAPTTAPAKIGRPRINH